MYLINYVRTEVLTTMRINNRNFEIFHKLLGGIMGLFTNHNFTWWWSRSRQMEKQALKKLKGSKANTNMFESGSY